MSIIAVIPSRYASTRLPGKPLVDICGKTMVQRVYEQVRKVGLFDDVLVATDDQRIFDAVTAFGGKAVMTSEDCPSGTDRLIEVATANPADIYVNIQGDEPLIDPALVDELAMKLKLDARWDMATAVTPVKSAADLAAKSVVKVVLDRHDGAMYFSRAPIPFDRDGEADLASGLYVRHLGIYAYRGAFLKRYIAEPPCRLETTEKLEQLRALWMGAKIAVVRTCDEGVGVDTPEDAERVGKILASRAP